MEATNDHILKAIALHFRPRFNLVAWYILHITSNIVRCISVCSLTSDSCHKLVVLVRNVVLCSYLRNRVNLVIPNLALCRVCHVAILFVKFLNLLQIRAFCLVVGSTKLIRSFKHNVFKVVCQACCFSRVVAATRTHGNVSLNAWLLFIYTDVDFQPVVEGVDACLHRVVGHAFVGTCLCFYAYNTK